MPPAPAWRISGRLIASSGPNQRHVCSIARSPVAADTDHCCRETAAAGSCLARLYTSRQAATPAEQPGASPQVLPPPRFRCVTVHVLQPETPSISQPPQPSKPFLSDVKTLREKARQHLSAGAITSAYGGDVKQTIEILQTVLATEIVCVLRYTMHAVAATGISQRGVKAGIRRARQGRAGAHDAVAERINQLGGKPNFNPRGSGQRSASQYAEGDTLVDMIKENLIAERIAVEHYQELIRFFGDDDPTTRVMLEGILTIEEEHANDMHDLLVAHEGRPNLPG